MNIITGYRGEPHITSEQNRDANQGSYGTGSYILDIGAKMAASIVSANEVRIADGALSHQGCLGNIAKGQYESCTIENGTQGMKRSDLIVCRYEKDSETNVESLSLVVIKGAPSSSTPSDPSYNSGNIQSGASPVDFPLYRVNINGVALSSITRLAPFVRTQNEMDTLLGNTSIAGIGNGTVTGAISTLNGNLTVQANSYIINGVTFVFRRYGRIVVVTSSGAATNAIPTNAYMGSVSVADAYKPISTEIQYVNATGVASIQFNLGTSGLLQVGYASAQIAAGANIRMATCYIASD